MELTYGWLILMIALFQYSPVKGLNFSVSTYGAYPDDNIDDTDAIQLTIDMAIKHGSNDIVIFGSGTYTLSSVINIVDAVNLTITGQGMHQTLLLGTVHLSIFQPYSCQQLTITSLSIDFNPLPFTAGYVVNVTDTYLDLQVQPPHQPDIGQQVAVIHRYNVTLMRPAFGPNTYEKFQTIPSNITTSLVSPGILRVPLTSHSEFIIGDAIVVRYAFKNHAINAQDVTDLTIQSVTTYTSWCMSFFALRARRLNVIDYHVLRKGDRWMSTIVDCMHFADAREYVNIFDSRCESMGDDGLNVHSTYLPVTQVINSTALVIQAPNSPEKLNFGIGTHLEFTTHAQPFTAYATAAIATSAIFSSDSRLFTFTSPINANINDWAVVADAPALTIRNFTVANNRARGVLLETRNIHMTQSLFNATSGPAVYFQPSLYWHEGPTARNVTLDHNLYINCNEGIAHHNGTILFLSDPIQLVPIVSDVRITSSTFLMGSYSRGILQIDNGANVSFSENYIATNNSMPLISLCNSRNISANNNTVVNKESKIDEYYTYDITNPCNRNLTSLINLPPSAFNSSFLPPVIPTKTAKFTDIQKRTKIINDKHILKNITATIVT
jgi:hypothetical protein